MNETFIFGVLEPNQYFIYKQEDKEENNREPHKYYHQYTAPILLHDDNKTLQDYDIHDNEPLHSKVHLKLLLKIPCSKFSIIRVYTDSTLKKSIKSNKRIQ